MSDTSLLSELKGDMRTLEKNSPASKSDDPGLSLSGHDPELLMGGTGRGFGNRLK